MKPFAIVLHGPTSAGKSTTATALQDCAQAPAFHVTLDAFVTMSRRRDMRSAEEQRLAYRIHCENLRSTLRRLVDTEFEIILDTVLRDVEELQACIDVLSDRPLCLVGITAPLETLERRESLREDRATGMAQEQVGHSAFARPYDVVIDTSTCTAKEAANVIRRYLDATHRAPHH
ncbi:AAA family ATPase [Hydrogenophaga sp. YM1]|nr:AAA family ATPase [Hydrogenophaga sp. YM1]QRR34163.1 AAA family ATPase [Hydrogenophaga sp. YM1]